MKKILVTTDLSESSKAAIYFALQLSVQTPVDLRFFHSYNTADHHLKNAAENEKADLAEKKKIQDRLERFVKEIYKQADQVLPKGKCVVQRSVIAQSNIMDYAAREQFDFICISTRGAGKIDRFFGTNTTNIINQSSVPVIAVPHFYTSRKIKKIMYASDMIHLETELEKVASFAKALDAKVELLHFTTPLEKLVDVKSVEILVEKISKYHIKMDMENLNSAENLVSNIESEVKKRKPSMMIMFTDQNRSFFQKIFYPAASAGYAFNPQIPLLVFHK